MTSPVPQSLFFTPWPAIEAALADRGGEAGRGAEHPGQWMPSSAASTLRRSPGSGVN
jgi:hypothetical protein